MLDVAPSAALGDEIRHRHEGRERGRERHRAGAWPAAAVRRREGLVQVEVHGVDAEIARAHLAHDGVEIRPIRIEEGSRRMHRLGDCRDVALEQPARVGIGEHDRRDLAAQALAHLGDVDGSVGAGRDRFHPVAEQGCGRRVGAVRGLRHQDDRAALAARRERGLDRHHAAQLAVRAGLGRKRQRRHAGELDEPAGEHVDQFERALDGRQRLQRMDVGEAGKPRHLLVEARIVLHGARAERIDAGVDAVVGARQAHVVAHRLRLAQAWKSDRRGPLERARGGA